ncbi:MAG: HK97 gp10 family phage protein [Castellaniella sp.]|uniref:HK97 gp10 family phage protein n=1 Tax=Castellaniella sp. TaxID=1955812 RepID=UPI0011F8AE02|nr:HK97 gp10 family phage protein [Castellaniella sp.]TAN27274.1 MAG: HK97 gp10 family phage protein [Castellaniella sp.]
MHHELDLWPLVVKANGNIDKAVRQALMLAAQGVVMNSPVLTGRLRASWGFGVDHPKNGPTGVTDKSGLFTLNQITAAIRCVEIGSKKFYITTGLPYAKRIEYEGWSKKAPAGMVRITIANLPNAIRDYARGLK